MNTEERLDKLGKAICEVADELAFTLRHLSAIDEIRDSDRHHMNAIAERLDLLRERLET